jgi:TorA maturation chaperone TorD
MTTPTATPVTPGAARADLLRALAAMAGTPTPQLAPVADALGLPRQPTAAEHTDLFTFQLYPDASVHLGPEGKLGGTARDRIAGFFRALNITPPPEPDHLAVLVHAWADLTDLDHGPDDNRARHARTALLHEHLQPWLPRYLQRVTELAPAPYRTWARLLADVLAEEATRLPAPTSLPAHLRDAPDLPDPRHPDTHDFLDALLAPVRSGLILTRADLARTAHDLHLGLRIGERAYMLRALLSQDHPATLHHLATEAQRQRDHLTEDHDPHGWWANRLQHTATLLTDLATDARMADATPESA